ncbi:multicopper oxidase domain-containing protein [Granulicoccus sp. GXG6511]|uniref:multicopper oxidase domain-containing protein n=1 Tax=Granulicoccus sp. GXG6511 TaxID=3381351 RepID=UPI003D7E8051
MNLAVSMPPRAAARKPTGRRRTMLLRSLPMLAWIVADIVLVVAHPFLPEANWLMVHLLLLGAVSNAIVVWSTYFADAVLRVPGGHAWRDRIVLGALNIGGIGVVAGLLMHPARAGEGTPWVLFAGATLFGAAAVIHAAGLLQQLRVGLAGQFVIAVRFYVAAALALPVGAWLGVRLADATLEHSRLLLAHLGANILGWVGLTIAGTLITLWPTILRTRAYEGAVPSGRRGWWVLVVAVALVVVGGLAGLRWLAVLGVLAYILGLALIAGPLVRVALIKRPNSFAPWSILAGSLWWIGCLGAAALHLAMAPDLVGGVAGVRGLVGPFAVGFIAQILVGALTYLLPVIVGGGPSVVRRSVAVAERGAVPRLGLVNLSALLYLFPVPSLVKVTLSLAVVAGLVWTVGVLIATVVIGLRAVRSATRPATLTRLPGKDDEADAATERRRRSGQAAAVVGAVALLIVAAAMVDPVAVVGRYVAPAGADPAVPAQAGTTPVAATGNTITVQVEAIGMRFVPAEIDVPAGDRLVIELTNTDPGQVHDLVFANGVNSGRLAPGASATVDVGIIGAALDGWCSIAGHRQMGMTMVINVIGHEAAHTGHAAPAGAPDAQADPQAEPGPDHRPRSPVLAPTPSGTVHRHTFTVQEKVTEVAPGVRQSLWTFNGTAPGTTLRGKVGDVFEITFVNDGTIGHGIDFHAGALAPDRPMRVIAPGERLTYRFTATRAGIWMYHCSAHPMSLHIANGMFGAVIIDPPDLPRVDREFILVQSEQYWGPQEAAGSPEKIAARAPDAVVFNGYPGQYARDPLEARTGERVRIWLLNAGPNESLAFHVVGGQFDSVWREGGWDLRCGEPPGAVTGDCVDTGPGGSQTLGLFASQGGFVELEMPEAGHYSLVNHQMALAERGAAGTLRVTD